MASIDDVKSFWDTHPLWTGEAAATEGSREFFQTHTDASLAMTGGALDERFWPPCGVMEPILDLGCGIGFWLEQFWQRGYRDITGADLSPRSLALAARRCEQIGADVKFSEQNAEAMTISDGAFSHVNCIGVIHHSPSPERSIAEIARVLRPGGTAAISIYYWNGALRAWPLVRGVASFAQKLGAKLRGRGRENMMTVESGSELVRLYDGADNPIGTAYTEQQFRQMLAPYFEVTGIIWHVFPSRILPFRMPLSVFRVAERICPFMICALVTKKF